MDLSENVGVKGAQAVGNKTVPPVKASGLAILADNHELWSIGVQVACAGGGVAGQRCRKLSEADGCPAAHVNEDHEQ